MKLKRIGLVSLGLALAIIYALGGLVQSLIIFLGMSQPAFSAQLDSYSITAAESLGGWMILVVPVISAIMGFLAGIILAAIYNWIVVKLTGGIKIELAK